MNLVSRFCFADGKPPDDAVVLKLLKYITWKPTAEEDEEKISISTRQMNILGCAIDPTPTVRSVLLQLLLRYR